MNYNHVKGKNVFLVISLLELTSAKEQTVDRVHVSDIKMYMVEAGGKNTASCKLSTQQHLAS